MESAEATLKRRLIIPIDNIRFDGAELILTIGLVTFRWPYGPARPIVGAELYLEIECLP